MAASTSDTSVGSHQVFISHRGVDMKHSFADLLHHALKDRGITSFLDIEELPKGVDVREYMLEAARRASIQVPIFTKLYGNSEWCLDELVEMMESKQTRKAKVIPVFYDLKSEELRTDTVIGPFAENFQTFLQTCKRGEETIKRWKHALEEASWLEGFRPETYGGRQGPLIAALVRKISDEIDDGLPVDLLVKPVGLDVKVRDVERLLCLDEKNIVQVVLIWGMGGLGKTTLASFIYYLRKKDFEEASFVEKCGDQEPIQIQDRLRKALLRNDSDMAGDINKGRAVLQNGLIKKKVLIILDDVKSYSSSVENVINLKKLCPGSRILLTSSDQEVFPHVNDFSGAFRGDRYVLQTMDYQDSLQLFYFHAFRSRNADPDFEKLAREVVKACDGLPLSLEVLGRHLSTLKEEKQWREAIIKLGDNKYKDISGRLMISYEALDDDQKEMFQDVACFFIGKYERRAKYFWDVSVRGCESDLQKLKQLCLVKVDEKKYLIMHDLLRDLGRDISRRSKMRLWTDEDLRRMLINEQDLGGIRGVATSLPCLKASELSKMRSLHLLFLNGTKLNGTYKRLQGPKVRWLEWKKLSS